MSEPSTPAEVDIHLRARPQDRALIDQAADLVGANRSRFMLASALKEAKSVRLDRVTLVLGTVHALSPAAEAFHLRHGVARMPVETPPLALDLVKSRKLDGSR